MPLSGWYPESGVQKTSSVKIGAVYPFMVAYSPRKGKPIKGGNFMSQQLTVLNVLNVLRVALYPRVSTEERGACRILRHPIRSGTGHYGNWRPAGAEYDQRHVCPGVCPLAAGTQPGTDAQRNRRIRERIQALRNHPQYCVP